MMNTQRTDKDLESVRWLATLLGKLNHMNPFSEESETVKGIEMLVNRLKQQDSKVRNCPGQGPLCLLMCMEPASAYPEDDSMMLCRVEWS